VTSRVILAKPPRLLRVTPVTGPAMRSEDSRQLHQSENARFPCSETCNVVVRPASYQSSLEAPTTGILDQSPTPARNATHHLFQHAWCYMSLILPNPRLSLSLSTSRPLAASHLPRLRTLSPLNRLDYQDCPLVEGRRILWNYGLAETLVARCQVCPCSLFVRIRAEDDLRSVGLSQNDVPPFNRNGSTPVHSRRSFESQTHTLYGYKPLRILAFSITSEVGSLLHRPPAYHDVCHSDSPSPSARVLPHLRKISIYACHLLCAEFV